MARVRVWDLPTRLFHWLLVACLACLLVTGFRGGAAIEWHGRFGYAMLALLLFRIAWGFVGGRWSRFASFLHAPRSVGAYLRGQAHPDQLVGHNPLGAGSVFLMLLALLAQVATGLVNDDEIAFQGPLNRFVSSAVVEAARKYHEVGAWVVIALAAVHVLAVLYYLVGKRQNLVRAMVTGDKELGTPATPSRDDAVSRIGALVVMVLAAAATTWVVRQGMASAF